MDSSDHARHNRRIAPKGGPLPSSRDGQYGKKPYVAPARKPSSTAKRSGNGKHTNGQQEPQSFAALSAVHDIATPLGNTAASAKLHGEHPDPSNGFSSDLTFAGPPSQALAASGIFPSQTRANHSYAMPGPYHLPTKQAEHWVQTGDQQEPQGFAAAPAAVVYNNTPAASLGSTEGPARPNARLPPSVFNSDYALPAASSPSQALTAPEVPPSKPRDSHSYAVPGPFHPPTDQPEHCEQAGDKQASQDVAISPPVHKSTPPTFCELQEAYSAPSSSLNSGHSGLGSPSQAALCAAEVPPPQTRAHSYAGAGPFHPSSAGSVYWLEHRVSRLEGRVDDMALQRSLDVHERRLWQERQPKRKRRAN